MLFNYELKKIWNRVSPILVAVLLGSTIIATLVITAIAFNHTPTVVTDVSANYTKLQTKIQNWNTTVNHAAFTEATEAFEEFHDDYRALNTSTLYDADVLQAKYNQAKTSFQNFYTNYYQHYIYTDEDLNDYLLVRTEYIEEFDNILGGLNNFFNMSNPNNEQINDGLKRTNPQWEGASLQNIFDNLFYTQEIDDEDLSELREFFATYPAGDENYDYTDAYDYALNRYWLAIAKTSTYQGDLTDYQGFSGYRDTKTSTRACQLAEYRLNHADKDFADPYTFGNIFNSTNQVRLFDFVFTNMEMAMLPLTFLVMVWAACVFFTDHYQNTLITPIAAGKKRSTIILTKTAVIISLTAVSLVLLAGIYAICGLLFFHAQVGPDVLFLFNNTQIQTMSVLNYFAVYFLDLLFKLLPLIAICGLFSFAKNKPWVIVCFTTLICVAVIVANITLGHFEFYQYVPLMGLDPLRYFGAKMLFAPMPEDYNLFYTFPGMVAFTIVLYMALIQIFRHHDF